MHQTKKKTIALKTLMMKTI